MAEIEMKQCWPNSKHIYDSNKHKECPFCKADRDLDKLRTLEQNKKFHAMLTDIARQVKWAGLWWDVEDWKRLVLGAHFGQVVAPNPFGHGLLVMNKKRSSELKKSSKDPNEKTMDTLINELQAFGDGEGVVWSDPTVIPLESYA